MKPPKLRRTWHRLLRVVSPRKPHLLNGTVQRIVSARIGSGNPLLPLLNVNCSVSDRSSICEHHGTSAAIIHNGTTVRYAAIALCQLVTHGFVHGYAHLYRLLDIVSGCNAELRTLDPTLLLELLCAFETIVRTIDSTCGHVSAESMTSFAAAVVDKSRVCSTQICDNASTLCDGPILGDFAAVMHRLDLGSAAFTKRLLGALNDDTSLFSSDALRGAFDYIVRYAGDDLHGCRGGLHRIMDELSLRSLAWHHQLRVLCTVAELDVYHPGFLDSVVQSLTSPANCGVKDAIGMDAVSSRDLCCAFSAMLRLDCELAAALIDVFLDRYRPLLRDGSPSSGIARCIRKCTLGELTGLLESIAFGRPLFDGAAATWSHYILQHRVPYVIGFASEADLREFLHVLGSLDPPAYHGLLPDSSATQWVYGVGESNVTRALCNATANLGPQAVAKAVLCYVLGVRVDCFSDLRIVLTRWIHTMCFDALSMLSNSSLLTSKALQHLPDRMDDGDLLFVPADKVASAPRIAAVAALSPGRFLYDPTLTSNFKFLKRGENRDGQRGRGSAPTVARSKGSRALARVASVLSAMPAETSEASCALLDPDSAPDAMKTAKEGASTLLKVFRDVHRSLCVYHHLSDMRPADRYATFPLETLVVVRRFLNAYSHVVPVFSTSFSKVDSRYSLYGVDASFEPQLMRELKRHDSSYVDPRFLCTRGSRVLQSSDSSSRTELRHSGARLRHRRVGMFNAPKSKVRINWDHFAHADDAREFVRARGPRRVAASHREEVGRVSQSVDCGVHGHRERVDQYEWYVSRHFKDGFACWSSGSGPDSAAGSSESPCGIVTSRLHKEVMRTTASFAGLNLKGEEPCGPYHIDLVCASESPPKRVSGCVGQAAVGTGAPVAAAAP